MSIKEEFYCVWRNKLDKNKFSYGVSLGKSYREIFSFTEEWIDELFGEEKGFMVRKLKPNIPIEAEIQLKLVL